jgi:hypothetical protein
MNKLYQWIFGKPKYKIIADDYSAQIIKYDKFMWETIHEYFDVNYAFKVMKEKYEPAETA